MLKVEKDGVREVSWKAVTVMSRDTKKTVVKVEVEETAMSSEDQRRERSSVFSY